MNPAAQTIGESRRLRSAMERAMNVAQTVTPLRNTHAQAGLTLLELMVAMAILSILLAIATPSLSAISEPQAVRGQVNAFLATLRYARSEAIRYRTPIVVCPSNNSESGTPSCSNGGSDDWSKGWIVFVNRDGDANDDFESSKDTLLRVQGQLSGSGGILKASGGAPNKFVIRTTGIVGLGGASAFTFDSVSKDATRRQRICVSMQGRARVSTSSSVCS
jgi:type IV fimbrial biogenesis protein FimT